MSRHLVKKCENCRKQQEDENDLYWITFYCAHDYDVIVTISKRTPVRKSFTFLDFCSTKCLREFFENLSK